MIFCIHRPRKHILAAGLASLLILLTGAAQAAPESVMNVSDAGMVQELPALGSRAFAPLVRVADLGKNIFSDRASEFGDNRDIWDRLLRNSTDPFVRSFALYDEWDEEDEWDEWDEWEHALLQKIGPFNRPYKFSSGGTTTSPPPSTQGGVTMPSDKRVPGGGMTTIEKPPISLGGPIIKDKIWFFGSWERRAKKGFGDQRVWQAYRESPPTRLYVYQQHFVPDLTSLQDLEVTRNGVQKPGFQLFPRFNGVVRVVTKNGITQFGGLYFQEDSLLRKIQDEKAVTPNDPYYMKEGGGGKSSPSKFSVGIGGLLKLGKVAIGVGSGSVGVGAGSVGIGVGKGSVGIDAGPFGIGIGGNSTDQWGLRAVGFTPLDDPASAWRLEDGTKKNVIVAVIDSGLDMAHPDGPQYVWTNPGEIPGNKIDDDGNGFIDDVNGWNFAYENNDLTDDNGHGTFVAGIIAAKTNNGMGIAGINPGAQIMPLKVVNRTGRCQSLDIFRALRYAANHGARVINISLGAEGLSRLEQLGVNYAHYRGAVVVVAAGNQAGDITKHGPPGLRKVFSVAATKMDGGLKPNSNFGPTVAVAAPGESIYSLTSKDGLHDGMITPMAPTEYHQLSGTSFAAPFVAGAASLMLAKNPELTNFEIEDIIMATARDMEAEGWDAYTGAGLLNAGAALAESGRKVLGARITEILINREDEEFVSADVYGTVRGDLESYTVEVGRGKNPKEWKRVYGPSGEVVTDGHLCRIERDAIDKEGEWVVRMQARDGSGRVRLVDMPISTELQRPLTSAGF